MNYMQLIKRFGLRIFKDICSSFHSFYIYSAPHCFACGMQSTKVWLSFVEWMGHHTVKFVFFFFPSNGWVQLSDPMDCSMPGFPVHHYLPELSVHWVSDIIQPILSSVTPFSSPHSFPASGSFPLRRLCTSGSQRIGASALVLPMNIWGWFPLRLVRSPCSPRDSHESSPALSLLYGITVTSVTRLLEKP